MPLLARSFCAVLVLAVGLALLNWHALTQVVSAPRPSPTAPRAAGDGLFARPPSSNSRTAAGVYVHSVTAQERGEQQHLPQQHPLPTGLLHLREDGVVRVLGLGALSELESELEESPASERCVWSTEGQGQEGSGTRTSSSLIFSSFVEGAAGCAGWRGTANADAATLKLVSEHSLAGGPQEILFARDPLGFAFPGCVYRLHLAQGEVDVILEHPGALEHQGGLVEAGPGRGQQGNRPPLLGSWRTSGRGGDELLLLLRTADAEEQTRLRTEDWGASWRGVAASSSAVWLELLRAEGLTQWPITPAMAEPLALLEEGQQGGQQGGQQTGRGGAGPIITSVLTPQLVLDSGALPPSVPSVPPFVVVISSGLGTPQTNKSNAPLRCHFDYAPSPSSPSTLSRPGYWLSWSMALCAMQGVPPGAQGTLSLSSGGQRVSGDFIDFRYFPAAPRAVHFLSVMMARFEAPPPPPPWGPSAALSPLLRLPPHSVAFCTMVRHEGPYLREWLEHHLKLGVGHFFVYDNGGASDSDSQLAAAVLAEFRALGAVTVVPWPHAGAQTQALNDCLQRHRHLAEWIGFIDVDEYIFTAQEEEQERELPPPPLLRALLVAGRGEAEGGSSSSMASRPVHCLRWVGFCKRDLFSAPPPGYSVRDTYLDRVDMGPERIHMQKPLFRPQVAVTLRKIGPHFLLFNHQDLAVQYSHNLACPYPWRSESSVYVRHYRSKSRAEFVARRVGADAAYKERRYSTKALMEEWDSDNTKCLRSDKSES